MRNQFGEFDISGRLTCGRYRAVLVALSHKRPLPRSKSAPPYARRLGLLTGALKPSDVDLLSDLDGIVDFNAEVPHRALDLGMSKQKLDCSLSPKS